MENSKTNLPKEEEAIIQAKYSGRRFGIMGNDERIFCAQRLLIVIHSIIGWTLPVADYYDILVDQFEKKMQESYSTLNEEEVKYAFRNLSSEVKDWGKFMNLSLLDEVLLPYLHTRQQISDQEEKKQKPIQIEKSGPLSDQEWEEWVTDIKTYPVNLIPVGCYDYLIRTAQINPTAKEKIIYLDKAMTIYLIDLEGRERVRNDFIKQKNTGVITSPHLDSLIVISKRLIVSEFLNQAK